MNRNVFGLAGFILFLGIVLAYTEQNHQQSEADHYCDMVQIYKDSQGKYGWPNYENRECN